MSDQVSVKKEYLEENGGSTGSFGSVASSSTAANSANGSMKEEGPEDEKYEESLDLDLSKENTKVWLVRLPKFLMDKWRDVEKNSGKELGQVRICGSNNANNKKEVGIMVAELVHTHFVSSIFR